MEDSYFRPFGQRTLSNQALYSASGVVVIYTKLGAANIMKYVSNRAAWLGRQDLMIPPSSSTLSDDEPIIQRFSNAQCSSGEPEMRTCQTPEPEGKPRAAKVAIADMEHFKSELANCGFSSEGKMKK